MNKNKEIPSLNIFQLDEHKLINVYFIDKLSDFGDSSVFLPHTKNHYVLRIVKHGSGVIYKNHIPNIISDNSITIDAPNEIVNVKIHSDHPIEAFIIAFTSEFVELLNLEKDILDFGQHFLSATAVIYHEKDFLFLYQIAQLIHEEYQKNPSGREDRLLGKLVESCLYHIFRNYSKHSVDSKINRDYLNVYKDFINLLNAHISSKHFVADYTELLMVNEKKLNRICKKVTGQTALQIIHKHLDSEIKHKLFYTNLSNKEISMQLGFNDTTHLYKFFKHMNGITPKAYKTKAQGIW